MTARGKPFFLQGRDGPIFCMNWLPSDSPARFGVLFVPAFAEEQNKSRRTTALLGRSLAESGGNVLVLDPTGTGDSGGEFGDATWETWLDDIRVGWAWMTGMVTGRKWLAGLRLGAMLATEFACAAPGAADGLLVIQPVTSGAKFVRQFLRVVAAQRISRAGGGPSEQPDLFALLESGNRIEVGGYEIRPELLLPVASRDLERMHPPVARAVWLECADQELSSIAPASRRVTENWQAQGIRVEAEVVEGPPFWMSQEITDAPRLVARAAALIS